MNVHCPRHDDNRPSVKIYPDGGWCFRCRIRIPLKELFPEGEPLIIQEEPDNIEELLAYAKSQPLEEIRGLKFHADFEGYYVIWPDESYCKKRLFRGDLRYMAPRGIRQPLFTYHRSKGCLFIIEGEINAMSVNYAYPEHKATIMSPGGIGGLKRYLLDYLSYENINIIIDGDEPGIGAGIELMDELLRKGKQVGLSAWDADINELLSAKGIDGIQEKFKEEGLEMSLLQGN